MAAKAAEWMLNQLRANCRTIDSAPNCDAADSACLIGLKGRQYKFTPVQILKKETDFK